MMPTILKFSLTASAFSSATVLPVTASVPWGTTADSRSASSLCETPDSALTPMVSNLPGVPSTFCAVVGVEVRRRRAAEVLDAVAVADGAHDGELLGRTLEEHLDRGAERDVVLLGAGGVDGDLVGAGGRLTVEDLHVAAQLLVGRHAVAVGRRAAGGRDRLAVVVGQQRVAAGPSPRRCGRRRRSGSGRGPTRRSGRGGADALGRGVRRLGADDRVGARRRSCRRAARTRAPWCWSAPWSRRGARRRVRSTPS